MFGVTESRTALVFGTNYSSFDSADDYEDNWDTGMYDVNKKSQSY